jgi:hypothetical protein
MQIYLYWLQKGTEIIKKVLVRILRHL